MKFLVVEMSDGKQWAVPALLIAKDRAAYYAKLDSERGEGDYDTIYEGEVDYALSNDYEITDWATGNMDWEDVSAYAIQLEVQPPKPNYNKDWANSPMSVKEMEL